MMRTSHDSEFVSAPVAELRREATVERIVERSRFVGITARLTDPDPRPVLDACRARFPNASHYCYACRWDSGQERADDNGEPHGTAGVPLLTVLQRHALRRAVVVVVRYFGGVKLGRPGLYRAYHEAAEQAVAASEPTYLVPLVRVELTCTYAAFEATSRWLNTWRPDHVDPEAFTFADVISWQGILPAAAPADWDAWAERWHGQVSVTVIEAFDGIL